MRFIRKLAACVTAAALSVSAFAVCAFAQNKIQFDDSVTFAKSGKTYTKTLSAGSAAVFSIEVSGKKTLTLDIDYSGKMVTGLLMNKDGKAIKPDKVSASKGNAAVVEVKEGHGLAIMNEDSTGCTGKARFSVSGGTYYAMISNYSTNPAFIGSGTLTFTPKVSAPVDDTKIERFMFDLKKGSSIQFGTVLTASTNTKVTWKSSNASVATVSSSGKITAKAKGKAVITAKLGDSTLKITVNVTTK